MSITILLIVILIMSAILHEYAHGWMANRLGDKTAETAGRLTLNPIAHIDIMGSIVLPLLMALSKVGFILGWAKPVPYNPYNLRDSQYGELKVAIAGPAANFILAVFFGFLARLFPISLGLKQGIVFAFFQGNYGALLDAMHGSLATSIFVIAIMVCFMNLLLMVFNLIPLPPLDGSKVLMAFLPPNGKIAMQRIEPYGTIIILFLLISGFFSFIWPVIIFLFSLIAGL